MPVPPETKVPNLAQFRLSDAFNASLTSAFWTMPVNDPEQAWRMQSNGGRNRSQGLLRKSNERGGSSLPVVQLREEFIERTEDSSGSEPAATQATSLDRASTPLKANGQPPKWTWYRGDAVAESAY